MADTTGRDDNRFGMSVNQSTDVHSAVKKKQQILGRHTPSMDGDVEQLTPEVAVDACKVIRENNGALRERDSFMS